MQSEIDNILKGKICTLNCPLDEQVIFQLIMENLNITQKEIANKIGKSERTVKNKVASLFPKDIGSSFDDGGNEKRFVDIDATAGLVNNFHGQKLLSKMRERSA